jgi:prepilin-type N-terminal cleavage/methylation domain-containing protein
MKTLLRNQKGFSLLEVLVAFAILSLGLSVVYEVFVATAKRQEDVAHKYDALLLAEEKLALALIQDPPPFGDSQQEAENGYLWHLSVSKPPEVNPELLFETIRYRVQVYRSDQRDENSLVDLETRRLWSVRDE